MSAAALGRSPQLRTVAVIHRDATLAPALHRHLPAGFDFKALPSHSDITALQEAGPLAAVVLDMDENGAISSARLAALEGLRRSDPEIVLLGITAHDSDEIRARLSNAGADDVVAAPPDAGELTLALRRLFERDRKSVV